MFATKQTVITVDGTLDATTVPDLERLVADNADTAVLTLDLTAVSSFDQAALDALLRIQSACASPLRVAPSEPVRASLVAARVAPRFTLADPL